MKKTISRGDLFGIPLKDESFLLGQVLSIEPEALNSIGCALFSARWKKGESIPPPLFSDLFSILLITRDLLDLGTWKVVGNAPVSLSRDAIPYESLRKAGFVGAKIVGSKIISSFANAFFGLDIWDKWADPKYLDKLLMSPDKRPTHVCLSRGEAVEIDNSAPPARRE